MSDPTKSTPLEEQHSRVVAWLRGRANETLGLNRLILFGSRARGDAHLRSDFDLAVESENWTHGDFAKFSLHCKENLPSLAGADIIWMNQAGTELAQRVLNEGKVIYSRDEIKSP